MSTSFVNFGYLLHNAVTITKKKEEVKIEYG